MKTGEPAHRTTRPVRLFSPGMVPDACLSTGEQGLAGSPRWWHRQGMLCREHYVTTLYPLGKRIATPSLFKSQVNAEHGDPRSPDFKGGQTRRPAKGTEAEPETKPSAAQHEEWGQSQGQPQALRDHLKSCQGLKEGRTAVCAFISDPAIVPCLPLIPRLQVLSGDSRDSHRHSLSPPVHWSVPRILVTLLPAPELCL